MTIKGNTLLGVANGFKATVPAEPTEHKSVPQQDAPSNPSRTERYELKDVLEREYNALWCDPTLAQKIIFEDVEDYYAAVHGHNQAALCLSGGGIRSAAFALGVVQALAGRGVLGHFQYLSTVSGGGYLGAWLSRWLKEAHHDVNKVVKALRGSSRFVGLAGNRAAVLGKPLQIAALRERSNFLTPRTGLASKDTWTVLAMVVRNLLLNWLLFLPVLITVALVFNVYRGVIGRAAAWNPLYPMALCAGSGLLLIFAVFLACRKLPSHAEKALRSTPIFWLIAVPCLIWSLVLPVVAVRYLGSTLLPYRLSSIVVPIVDAVSKPDAPSTADWSLAWSFAIISAVPPLAGYMSAWLFLCRRGDRRHFLRNVPSWLLATVVSSLALGLGVYLLARAFRFDPGVGGLSWDWRLDLLAVLGPLWVVLAHVLHSSVFVAFRVVRNDRAKNGHPENATGLKADLDREWLARLSAVKLRPVVAWTVLGFACLILPPVIFNDALHDWFGRAHLWVTGAVGAISGVLSVLGGASKLTSLGLGTIAAKQSGRVPDLVVNVATAVFVLVLFLALGRIELGIAAWAGGASGDWTAASVLPTREMFWGQVYVTIGLAIALAWLPFAIEVNRFSLHGLYRNRLARAFLGAGRNTGAAVDPEGQIGQAWRARHSGGCSAQRDPFTDFDPCDNVRMTALWPQPEFGTDQNSNADRTTMREQIRNRGNVLFPVINTTLNSGWRYATGLAGTQGGELRCDAAIVRLWWVSRISRCMRKRPVRRAGRRCSQLCDRWCLCSD